MTPMYDGLESNLPHNLMRYSDDLTLEDQQLLPTREFVVRYLETYSEDVRGHVRFETEVTRVELDSRGVQDQWSVQARDLRSKNLTTSVYDAVVVANGHFNVPTLPRIPGLTAWNDAFPGIITHSKHYRNARHFHGKRVLIIGASASGTDLASQISCVARLPVYISQRSASPQSYPADYKKAVPEIAEFLSPSDCSKGVRFVDGTVVDNIDAVVFCTGYYYSCPFLKDLKPAVITTGDRVENLYQHLFCIPHPSLTFLGLPSRILPFRTFEAQAAVVTRVWTGRLDLPSADRMYAWEAERVAKSGSGRSFHVLPFPQDMDYIEDMVTWASSARDAGQGKLPPQFSKKERWQRGKAPLIKKAFIDLGERRHDIKTVEQLGFDYSQHENGK